MAVHKLTDWELEEEPYVLIAIHATSEPYRMAYLINKHLELGFSRTKIDQDILQQAYTANYPVYKHFDKEQNAPFYLIPNKYWGVSNQEKISLGLFDHEKETQVKTLLIKEYGTVDFLLKIEKDPDFFPVKKLINALGEIPQVISVYAVDTFKIKQQDYLIFE
ncbi:IPExxxVDY family protein [Nonlabens sp.]|uniref:IPExxxVDY family protein n=1 Tax=Nonlabens sp. TaxID=1888209 RepID=UPI001BCC6338|nr:IPExxxVDY family protein [Nonlabens sp.]